MYFSVIDLGTNTFNLLIADNEGKPVHSEKIAVKLGKAGISEGIIAYDATLRAIEALNRFREKSAKFGVEHPLAIATSAVRSASNQQEFCDEIKKKTGIEIKVISGDEEAELIYEGVKQALDLGDTPTLIVDIGGGSVEFIIGNRKDIFWKQSFEIGGQRLLDEFHKTDPISTEEINRLYTFFRETLHPLLLAANRFKPETLIGSSGSFDTLAEIDILRKQEIIDYGSLKHYMLLPNDFNFLFDLLKSKTRKERLAIPGMIEMRVDMIVVSCCLVDFLMHSLQLKKIKTSAYSLKEGVMKRLIDNASS